MPAAIDLICMRRTDSAKDEGRNASHILLLPLVQTEWSKRREHIKCDFFHSREGWVQKNLLITSFMPAYTPCCSCYHSALHRLWSPANIRSPVQCYPEVNKSNPRFTVNIQSNPNMLLIVSLKKKRWNSVFVNSAWTTDLQPKIWSQIDVPSNTMTANHRALSSLPSWNVALFFLCLLAGSAWGFPQLFILLPSSFVCFLEIKPFFPLSKFSAYSASQVLGLLLNTLAKLYEMFFLSKLCVCFQKLYSFSVTYCQHNQTWR